MVFQLSSKKDLDFLANTFKMIDKNGNGQISKDEFAEGYTILYGKNTGKT
jgi:Ca2+-binding EF-hand superfamily protein